MTQSNSKKEGRRKKKKLDLLQLKPASLASTPNPADAATRFFTIASKLPMELQMILCHRAVGSMKDSVLSQDSEVAFKSLAKTLLRLASSSKWLRFPFVSCDKERQKEYGKEKKCKQKNERRWKRKGCNHVCLFDFYISSFPFEFYYFLKRLLKKRGRW